MSSHLCNIWPFKKNFYVILKLLFRITNILSHFHVQHDLKGCIPQCFNSPNKICPLSLYFFSDLQLRTPFVKHRSTLNSTAPIHLSVHPTIHASIHPSICESFKNTSSDDLSVAGHSQDRVLALKGLATIGTIDDIHWTLRDTADSVVCAGGKSECRERRGDDQGGPHCRWALSFIAQPLCAGTTQAWQAHRPRVWHACFSAYHFTYL